MFSFTILDHFPKYNLHHIYEPTRQLHLITPSDHNHLYERKENGFTVGSSAVGDYILVNW